MTKLCLGHAWDGGVTGVAFDRGSMALRLRSGGFTTEQATALANEQGRLFEEHLNHSARLLDLQAADARERDWARQRSNKDAQIIRLDIIGQVGVIMAATIIACVVVTILMRGLQLSG